jgi:hypothetical protein
MTSKLATLRSKIKLSFFFCYILNIKLLIRSQYPPPDKKHSKLSYYLLILSKNKENVTFTWPTGVQNVLFFTNMKQALPESLRNRYQSWLLGNFRYNRRSENGRVVTIGPDALRYLSFLFHKFSRVLEKW